MTTRTRTTVQKAHQPISRLEDFTAASMSGWRCTKAPTLGSLPKVFQDLIDSSDVDYVVFSYSTPIAWHTPDGWVVPPVRYSVTTSKHQGQARWGAQLSDDDVISTGPVADVMRAEGYAFRDGGWFRPGKGRSPYGPRDGW